MIDVTGLRNQHGKLKERYHLYPDFSDDDDGDRWVLYNSEDCAKELRRLQRTVKGRKHLSILVGFGDHMSEWVEVSWKMMYDMVRDRRQRYANCEYNQVWHLKVSHDSHISVWPTYLRDNYHTKANNWGEQQEE